MYYGLYNEDTMSECNGEYSSQRYVEWNIKEHSDANHPGIIGVTLNTSLELYDEQFSYITHSKTLIIRKIDFKCKNSINMLNRVKKYYKKIKLFN